MKLGRVFLATSNLGKLQDFAGAAAPSGVRLEGLPGFASLASVAEDGTTFEENARKKAEHYSRFVPGEILVADDSGLEVDALGGGPGVRTRRYAGETATDADNNDKLLRELSGTPAARRGARYVCVLALALPERGGPRGGLPLILRRGTCRGRIAVREQGSGGFGYDPLFEPRIEPPGGRTLGLWSVEEKNRISHRSKAARAMTPVLVSLGLGVARR